MAKPVVAIVGRPNVGKSQLFNRFAGKRLSIVEDTPGITRDRLYADSEWRGRAFQVIDTGGIEPSTDSEILKFMRMQAEAAIQAADVIILMTDLHSGVTATDEEIAAMLRRSRKPVVLAVNKCDRPGAEPPEFYEFYNMGLGDPFAISALHGYGTGDLLDACYEYFPEEVEEEPDSKYIKVALIGKPNVGKSSLVNQILGEKRVIVSNIAGTTRDSVDSKFENSKGKYMLIDTAGIRKRSRVDERVEKFSVMRSLMAVERADVCVIMIDAVEGVTEQDGKTMDQYTERVRIGLSYMPYAPILFLSAKTGARVHKLFDCINDVYEQNGRRIPTGQLNTLLAEATARVQPPTDKGRRLKIYYMTQSGVRPPTFVCFCNDAQLFHFSYQRYLENQIRDVYGLKGTPIRMIVRERGGKEE